MTTQAKGQAPTPPAGVQVHLEERTTRVGICNTYTIDKTSSPEFVIANFGLILTNQVLGHWSFAIAKTLPPLWQKDFFAYAERVKKLVKVETFEKRMLPFGGPQENIIPVDFIALAQQDVNAEISFHGWSLHAATRVAQDSKREPIQAEMLALLRCSIHLQMSWLFDLYA